MAGRLEQQLADCVQDWAGQEFDICKELDGDYPEWLSKYVDVTDDTSTIEDDDNGELFERAGNNSEQFSNESDEFYQTYDEYQEARENNDTDRARQKARELTQLAADANETGTALKRDFRRISNETDATLTPVLDELNLTLEEITTIAEEVERETFEQTQTTATIDNETVSCSNPATVSGQLTTQNGTPIRNETVTLEIGNRIYETRTNDSGGYSVEYCSTTLPTDTDELTVRFIPDADSPYAGSETVLGVGTLEPSTPTVIFTHTPAEARYNETVTIAGTVYLGDVGVNGMEDVPVTITLAGTRLATVVTNETGQYTTTVTLPAEIPAGEQPLEASVGEDGTALTPANASTNVTIVPTETNLTIENTTTSTDTVTVRGTLRPSQGPPVDGLAVRFRIDGEPITQVSTRPDGSFAATLDVPARMVPDPGENVSLTVMATYDGQTGNLLGDDATAAVQLSNDAPPGDPSADDESTLFGISYRFLEQWFETLLQQWIRWTLVGVGVLLLVGGRWAAKRRGIGDQLRHLGPTLRNRIRRRREDLAATAAESRLLSPGLTLWTRITATLAPIVRAVASRMAPYLQRLRALLRAGRKRLAVVVTVAVTTGRRFIEPLRTVIRTAATRISALLRALGARPSTWLSGATLLPAAVADWRSDDQSDASEEPTEPDDGARPASDTDTVDESPAPPAPSWDDRALEQLEAGNADAAITIAYDALRASVADRVVPDRALTHWEFFNTLTSAGISTTQRKVLREIVEAYERAAFAPTASTREQARQVIDAVREFQTSNGSGTDFVADD